VFGSWDELGRDGSIPFFLVFGWESRWDGTTPHGNIPVRCGTSLSAQNERTDSSHLGHGAAEQASGAAVAMASTRERRGERARVGTSTAQQCVELAAGCRKRKERVGLAAGCRRLSQTAQLRTERTHRLMGVRRTNSASVVILPSIPSFDILLTTNRIHFTHLEHRFMVKLTGISNLAPASVGTGATAISTGEQYGCASEQRGRRGSPGVAAGAASAAACRRKGN
jgi:hypothetical protein